MSGKSEEQRPTCAVAESALARAGAMELENMRLRRDVALLVQRVKALEEERKDLRLRLDEALAT